VIQCFQSAEPDEKLAHLCPMLVLPRRNRRNRPVPDTHGRAGSMDSLSAYQIATLIAILRSGLIKHNQLIRLALSVPSTRV